jgi:hypothetical protein
MKIAVALVATTAIAHAGAPPTAIEIDREDAPAGRVELGFDGGAPLAGWGVSLAAGLLDKPITIGLGDSTVVPISLRESLILGGALALGSSVVVDLRLPMSRQTGDQLTAMLTAENATRYVLGDLRLAARIRIAGDADRAVFLRAALTFPTGAESDFAGDERWSLAWNIIGRATLPAGIVIAANAGIHIRGAEVTIGDRLVGDEVTGAAGAIVPIPPIAGLWCDRSQVALTAEIDGVLGDNVNGVRGPSPIEARGGIVISILPELSLGLRGGRGIDNQIGAPAWRAMLEVSWRGAWNPFPAQPHVVAPERETDPDGVEE